MTKEQRQIAKLNLAQTKRQTPNTAGYRYWNQYDIDSLPTKYVGNNVVNNSNTGGLLPHRPWTTHV
jgi:hypothetical protein